VTASEREAALAKFADKMVSLAARHPASGVLRELVKGELREFLRQMELAVVSPKPVEVA
jgi:hypothetical protein